MGTGPIQAVLADIDQMEEEEDSRGEPFADIVPLMIPMPTYAALSKAAAKKNLTVVQLIAEGISRVLEE